MRKFKIGDRVKINSSHKNDRYCSFDSKKFHNQVGIIKKVEKISHPCQDISSFYLIQLENGILTTSGIWADEVKPPRNVIKHGLP